MDLVDKLHQRLVAAVAAADEGAFPGGITVADVYQRLIPYRAVRGQLGVVELAEYEHALLRLLAGEKHYLEVGDPAVRVELQRELASLNPILGIYRDYSGTRVSFGPGPDRGNAGAPLPDPEATGSKGTSEAARGGGVHAGAEHPSRSVEPAAPVPATADKQNLERTDTPSWEPTIRSCDGCARPLPGLPDLLFCPFCGRRVTPAPCAHCGAAMDHGWVFCARCGTPKHGVAPGSSDRSDA